MRETFISKFIYYLSVSFNRFAQYIFYFDEYIIRKGYLSVTFEKLTITHSDLNATINISHFKSKVLEAINHLKGISHKRPDTIFDFITRETTYIT